ncbi:MAG TPA: accessory Sec system S-layer assembly protein [Pseudoneobacillus sp.]|nr:accessory Sec system S-layer assembly protein [Pseudoneobacillus sp.]
MLSFFKKKKKSGEDSIVSSEELLHVAEGNQTEAEVQTELAIHPSMNIPKEQQYVLRFLNNDLPPLKPNQISLAGIDLHQDEEGIIISAFVRNSLPKSIKFEKTDLLLIGPNGESLARKSFDLSELGELPAKSSRPWNFTFEKSTLLAEEIPLEGWKLAFELKAKHQLDLAETWENSLSPEDKEKLTGIVEKLEPPKSGEVNFLGLQAKVTEQNELHVTMLIRNGSNKNIKLEQLPLQVEDASGETIAKGGFKLDDFEVKANTSKPWTFIFPQSLLLKESIDLSRWKAFPIQNN